MSVQVPQGQVLDPDQAHATFDRWAQDLATSASGRLVSSPKKPPGTPVTDRSRSNGGPRSPRCLRDKPLSARATTSPMTSTVTRTTPVLCRSSRAAAAIRSGCGS